MSLWTILIVCLWSHKNEQAKVHIKSSSPPALCIAGTRRTLFKTKNSQVPGCCMQHCSAKENIFGVCVQSFCSFFTLCINLYWLLSSLLTTSVLTSLKSLIRMQTSVFTCHPRHDGLDACQISGILQERIARQADKPALAMLPAGFFSNVTMVRTFAVVFPHPPS